jgi:energy-coupling factor transporter ATP-binding protein EcfA2
MPPAYSLLDLGEESDDRYRLRFSGGDLIRSSRAEDALLHLLWHINAEAFRRTGDFLLIHAGAVVAPETGDAILLPGGTGSGKTTLVAALISEGFDYLSDEAAAIDPVSNLVYPFPRALAFKQGSWEVVASIWKGVETIQLDGGIGNQRHVLPEDLRAACRAQPSPVRTIVSVKYESSSPTEIVRVSRAAAAVKLAEGALNLRTYRERGIELIGRVVRDAECYQLRSGDLREAVGAVSKVALAGLPKPRE